MDDASTDEKIGVEGGAEHIDPPLCQRSPEVIV
jgi:hypothetical protein